LAKAALRRWGERDIKSVCKTLLAALILTGSLGARAQLIPVTGSDGNPMVTDTALNVTWADIAPPTTLSWSNASPPAAGSAQHWIASLNAAKYGGYNDWALPTGDGAYTAADPSCASVQEQNGGQGCGPSTSATLNLLDYVLINELGNTPGSVLTITNPFQNLNVTSGYWSSSVWTNFPGEVWYFLSSLGYELPADPTSSGGSALPVRSGQVASVLRLTPTSLAFGSEYTGAISVAQQATVANVSLAAGPINSITIGGPNANQFSKTTACGTSLAVGARCTISVKFKPTSTGVKSAELKVDQNQVVALTGSGVPPPFTLSPTSLSFPTQSVGTTSVAQPVNVTNVGVGVLPISSITLSGPSPSQFLTTTTCSSSLALGANCTISVQFRPTSTGVKKAKLNVNAGSDGTRSVALSGTGA
jgi:hypothetical protein